MLGRAISAQLAANGVGFEAPSHQLLDVCDPLAVRRGLSSGKEIVINCTGFTAVDDAEDHSQAAFRLNATAVGILAAECKRVGSKLVHFSTDYVFDGTADTPYRANDVVAPINRYGASKAAGEHAVSMSRCDALIVRTSWLYAHFGKNFLTTMYDLMQNRRALSIVDDQIGCPTSARQLAKSTLALLDQDACGIYQVVGRGACSWYEFACHIQEVCGFECDLTPCDSATFDSPADRPKYSVLDTSKADLMFGPAPLWRTSVAEELQILKRSPDAIPSFETQFGSNSIPLELSVAEKN